MITIIYIYIMARKISVENPDWSEWVPNYLCENPRRYSLKESILDFSVLIVIWYVMIVLEFSTHTVLIGELSDVPG